MTSPPDDAGRPLVRITIPHLVLAGCALATLLGAWILLGGGERSGLGSDASVASGDAAASPTSPGMTDLSGKRSVFDDEPPVQGAFAVQVFQGDELAARALEQRLRARGFEAQLVPGGDGGRTRVRVTYPDRAAAEAGARRLEREEHLPTWIVPSSAR